MTIGGEWIAGMCIVHEFDRRGWFCAYPSRDLVNGFQVRPMFQTFHRMARTGAYTELRAWILADHPLEERFASWFGFRLDCGPASGFSPTGHDMNLWKWSADE